MSEALAPYTCPRCLGGIPNNEQRGEYIGALSRADNTTEICSDCGTEEAMLDYMGLTLTGPDKWPLKPALTSWTDF